MKAITHMLYVKFNLHFIKKHFKIPLKKYELCSTPTFKVSSITQMTRVWTAGCFFTGWSFKGGSSDTLKWFKTLLLSLTCLDEANRLNLKKGWRCWRRSITGGGWCFGKFLQEFKSFLPLMPGLHLEHCPVVSWQNKGFLFNWHQRDLKQTLRWDLTSARVWKWNLMEMGHAKKLPVSQTGEFFGFRYIQFSLTSSQVSYLAAFGFAICCKWAYYSFLAPSAHLLSRFPAQHTSHPSHHKILS